MVKASSNNTLVSVIVIVALIFPEVVHSQALSPSDSVAGNIWFHHRFNISLQIFSNCHALGVIRVYIDLKRIRDV